MLKPILFNTEMVRAILDGKKTQTRRIVKKKYSNTDLVMFTNKYGTRLVERQNDVPPPVKHPDGSTTRQLTAICELTPPFKYGDILWVRETWAHGFIKNTDAESCDGRFIETPVGCGTLLGKVSGFFYRAHVGSCTTYDNIDIKWRPSIHMPKEAARIFLRVKSVRAERLQDTDEEAAIAEGIDDSPAGTDSPLQRFSKLWDTTIKRDQLREFGFHANPWVWVIEFEQCDKLEAFWWLAESEKEGT